MRLPSDIHATHANSHMTKTYSLLVPMPYVKTKTQVEKKTTNKCNPSQTGTQICVFQHMSSPKLPRKIHVRLLSDVLVTRANCLVTKTCNKKKAFNKGPRNRTHCIKLCDR